MSKLLLYCTKANPTLYNVLGKFITTKYMGKDFKQDGLTHPELNGKIVAECDFEVNELSNNNNYHDYLLKNNSELWENDILTKSCLTYDELNNYLKGDGYAIYIKNLHIFDKPKELSEYEDEWEYPLEKAPQNMRRCYSTLYSNIEADMPIRTDSYILISIRPKWLCKILNGEKTIEVRKKVLKEMIN